VPVILYGLAQAPQIHGFLILAVGGIDWLATGGADGAVHVWDVVQPARLLYQTRPEYPDDLQQLGIKGTVVIRAIISKYGDVLSPQVVNTDIDPRLVQFALDAVKQWRYQPSLLNGQPVETITTLTIDFTLN